MQVNKVVRFDAAKLLGFDQVGSVKAEVRLGAKVGNGGKGGGGPIEQVDR